MLEYGDKTYYHARICLNGHTISGSLQTVFENEEYYQECGKLTIIRCQNCQEYIMGWVYNPLINMLVPYPAPAFCRFCGKEYLWTTLKKEALKEAIQFDNELSENDKRTMEQSIDDIISETPKTKIASMKFKQGLGKAGKETARIAKDILVDILSETGKRIILGV